MASVRAQLMVFSALHNHISYTDTEVTWFQLSFQFLFIAWYNSTRMHEYCHCVYLPTKEW